MDIAIEAKGLTKQFNGDVAVDNLSLKVRPGEIYGFVGLNGAGKTTTIRMLLGLIRPTRGSAYLLGQPVHAGRSDIWSRVGYMVETPHAYPELTVRENLEVVRRLRLVSDPRAADRIIERLGLRPHRDKPAGVLSQGNRRRLGLAKALIHRPSVLLLDEPTNGLDPAGINEVRALLLLVTVVFPLLIGLVLAGPAGIHSPVVVEQTPHGCLTQYQTVIAIGGLIGFGFLFSWIFGREYADCTVTDLLALPVPRTHIALAKFFVVLVWCAVLSVVHFAVGCIFTGLALQEPLTTGLTAAAFGRYCLTSLMVIALSTPVAWVASGTRGYLAPLGFVVLTIVLAQVLGAWGIAAYFPWAVPALFSGIIEGAAFELEPISLLLPFVVVIGGDKLTHKRRK